MVERGRSKSLLAVTAAVARRSYYLRWTKGRLPSPGVPEAGRRRERKTPWDPDFRLLPFISRPSYVAQPMRHMRRNLCVYAEFATRAYAWAIRPRVRVYVSCTRRFTTYPELITRSWKLAEGFALLRNISSFTLPPFFSSHAVRIVSLLDYAS